MIRVFGQVRRFCRERICQPLRRSLRAPEAVQTPPAPFCITADVMTNLEAEYAHHRSTARGHEETGWLLIGRRTPDGMQVVASIPAGERRWADRDFVRFDPAFQTVSVATLRTLDRRLEVLGLVHTHPGSLRHPSAGDYRGDIAWAESFHGKELLFGIGTAAESSEAVVSRRPARVKCGSRFDWYALRTGDRTYRSVEPSFPGGGDLGQAVRAHQTTIEIHCGAVDRLLRLLREVRPQATAEGWRLRVGCGEPNRALLVCASADDLQYYVTDGESVLAVDPQERRLDRGVLKILAALPDVECSALVASIG